MGDAPQGRSRTETPDLKLTATLVAVFKGFAEWLLAAL
jgi:hypothetical protein